MDIKKIYLFAPVKSQYGVMDYFTEQLCEALKRQGIDSKIMKSDPKNPKEFLQQLLTERPDCTLSFNGLLPDGEGRFLSDMINIPHVAVLIDAPTHYFLLAHSRNTIITCVDLDFINTFKNMGCSRLIFLPHATHKDIKPNSTPEYDVVLLNSFIDYEKIRVEIEKQYGTQILNIVEEAAERVLSEENLPYMTALVDTIDSHLKKGKNFDPKKIDFEDLLDKLEGYFGGKSRIELLKSIKGVKVHVFGSQPGKNEWKKYLGPENDNIIIHDVVSFEEAIQIMSKTKILLNITPEIKHGLHERISSGMAAGAAVVALKTTYLSEMFEDEKDILFFSPRNWKEMNEKIQKYLSNETLRSALVNKARANVLKNHTWDQRAKTLLEQLSPILKSLS